MPFAWPVGFDRVPPAAQWTQTPVDQLALKYDTVEHHGWYRNLDRTVADVSAHARDGDVLVDYSGGTGILIERLLHAVPDREFGIVDVDSSPKFLRLALEKLRHEPRVAFRLIRYLKDARRLQYVDEVLGPEVIARGVDAILSTNAIHLYADLENTLASWARTLRGGGRLFIQSGNIDRADRPRDRWIIDGTVEAIHEAAIDIVRSDSRYAHHRAVLGNASRMAAYDALRRKYFVPVRALEYYTDALRGAGFRVERIGHEPIRARAVEWFQFLAVYHEGVLGWIGGAAKVEGRPASEAAVRERLQIAREAMDRVLEGADAFDAEWTYVTCTKA